MKLLLAFLLGIFNFMHGQRVANFVTNGSFEQKYNGCTQPVTLEKAVGWLSIDSNSYGGTYRHFCLNSIPLNGNTYQLPKSGQAYLLTNFYDKSYLIRGYPKNRLKQNLLSGHLYCVKFYINITNKSPRGIDRFGAYFGDGTIDTIKKTTLPITYLTPQINNPQGNIISDTLNWVPITGTFVATGNEKYLVLGNFYSDLATNTTSLNSPYYPEEWTDVCIDDVSCIEMNVPAYAGPDKRFLLGDSVYLGRELDFAIDPYCFWYKLPNTITAIDTASGIWVKPTSTSTYVVRQELECNSVKWDTVVVYKDAVGIEQLKLIEKNISLYPQPASDFIQLNVLGHSIRTEFTDYIIYDEQLKIVREEKITKAKAELELDVSNLPAGLYTLRLVDENKGWSVGKRFVKE
jgi:hypothetical protein